MINPSLRSLSRSPRTTIRRCSSATRREQLLSPKQETHLGYGVRTQRRSHTLSAASLVSMIGARIPNAKHRRGLSRRCDDTARMVDLPVGWGSRESEPPLEYRRRPSLRPFGRVSEISAPVGIARSGARPSKHAAWAEKFRARAGSGMQACE